MPLSPSATSPPTAIASRSRFGEHRMMFRPRDSHDQRLIDARLDITPEPAQMRWIHDVFGNCVALARFDGRASRAALREHDSARPLRRSNVLGLRGPSRRCADLSLRLRRRGDARPDARRSSAAYPDPNGEIDRWARKFLRPGRPTPTRDAAEPLTHAIREGFTYTRRSRARHAGPAGDAASGPRHLPRLRAADDRGGALARPRRALRVRLSLLVRDARDGGGRMSAAARPMPGCRSICRAPAGSSSTRPTASSATAT